MDNNDKKQFKELFDGLSEYYQSKEKLSKMALQIYFDSLLRFSFEDISRAVSAHVVKPNGGKFYPRAGDLMAHLEGEEVTADIIIAAAQLGHTPMGILARIHIGTWDLKYANSFDLKQRAQECLLLMPEWKARADMGEYSDHELSIMMKYHVDPRWSFSLGVSGPAVAGFLDERMDRILNSDRHKMLMEPVFDPSKEPRPNKAQLKLIHSKIKKELH